MIFVRTILLIVVIFNSSLVAGSVKDTARVDTVIINATDAGIPFKYFDKIWYHEDQIHGYKLSDISKQDKVLLADINQYLMVYDWNNKLLLEGLKTPDLELVGKVLFYHKSGNIKRIENWGNSKQVAQNNGKKFYTKKITPEGSWTYYRPDGTLRKEIVYCISKLRESPLVLIYSVIERKYNHKGVMIKEVEREIRTKD